MRWSSTVRLREAALCELNRPHWSPKRGRSETTCNGIADHWFELATIALLAVIAINTLDSRWNNATIVEQLNDIIRRFSWLARRNAESRRNSSS
jgi:hypothetical protein